MSNYIQACEHIYTVRYFFQPTGCQEEGEEKLQEESSCCDATVVTTTSPCSMMSAVFLAQTVNILNECKQVGVRRLSFIIQLRESFTERSRPDLF